MRETRSRNIKGSALRSISFFFQESAAYIHRSIFANRVGSSTLGRPNHVYCFQAQLAESCLGIWFWVDKRPFCCFFLYKKQSGYPD